MSRTAVSRHTFTKCVYLLQMKISPVKKWRHSPQRNHIAYLHRSSQYPHFVHLFAVHFYWRIQTILFGYCFCRMQTHRHTHTHPECSTGMWFAITLSTMTMPNIYSAGIAHNESDYYLFLHLVGNYNALALLMNILCALCARKKPNTRTT